MVGCISVAMKLVTWAAWIPGSRSPYDLVMVVAAKVARNLAVNDLITDLVVGSSWYLVSWVLLTFPVFGNDVVQSVDVHPSSLPLGEHFWHWVLLEGLMVTLYEDVMIHSLEVVTPLLHTHHDDQWFLVVHVLLRFSTWVFLRVEVHRSENPKTVLLVKNTGYGEAACIDLLNNLLSWFETPEDGCITEGSFELPECEFGVSSSFPLNLFKHPRIVCIIY